MKPREQAYAMERIEEIAEQKFRAIEKELPVLKPKRITYKRALVLIKQGKIKLKPNYPDRELYSNDDFDNVFDVTEYHEDTYNFSPYDKKAYEKKAEPIRKEVRRIKDQIMLGDATEALKLIEEFASM